MMSHTKDQINFFQSPTFTLWSNVLSPIAGVCFDDYLQVNPTFIHIDPHTRWVPQMTSTSNVWWTTEQIDLRDISHTTKRKVSWWRNYKYMFPCQLSCALSVYHLRTHIYIWGSCVFTLRLRCYRAHCELKVVLNQHIVNMIISWTHGGTSLLVSRSAVSHGHVIWLIYLTQRREKCHGDMFSFTRKF